MLSKLTFRIFLGVIAVACFAFLSIFFLGAKPTPNEKGEAQASTVHIPSSISSVIETTIAASTTAVNTVDTNNSKQVAHPVTTSAPIVVKISKVAPTPNAPIYTPLHLQLAGLPTTVYIPQNLPQNQPVQLLIALHGMHGNGGAFCQGLVSFSEQNRTILLAPTFDYDLDYKNSQVVAKEDIKLTAQLNQMIKELSATSHIQFKSQAMLYGFSRGAQLADHYALLYPKQTLAVTIFSGGAYTLPFINISDKNNQTSTLAWPIGIGDLSEYTKGKAFDDASFAKIAFNIEVGGNDNNPDEVSRAWDDYLGNNRMERGQNYYHALQQLGMNVQFTVFPNTDHTVSPAMNQTALKFMQTVLATQVAA